MVLGYNVCENFKLGERKVKYVEWMFANELSVKDILNMDKLAFTVEG